MFNTAAFLFSLIHLNYLMKKIGEQKLGMYHIVGIHHR
jgi:hypothetical protein